MKNPYEVLNLPMSASNEEIRMRYLELVRQFPPESAPAMAILVRAAYDKIKTTELRANYFLTKLGSETTLIDIIAGVDATVPRPRLGLGALVSAQQKVTK